MWKGCTPPAPQLHPLLPRDSFSNISSVFLAKVIRELGREGGGGGRSVPGAFFGYLGFRSSMYSALAHRRCHHHAVTRMWGPSVIRVSDPGCGTLGKPQ